MGALLYSEIEGFLGAGGQRSLKPSLTLSGGHGLQPSRISLPAPSLCLGDSLPPLDTPRPSGPSSVQLAPPIPRQPRFGIEHRRRLARLPAPGPGPRAAAFKVPR